jgi:hypothetical protein
LLWTFEGPRQGFTRIHTDLGEYKSNTIAAAKNSNSPVWSIL